MKFKKGNPITSLDELAGEIRKDKPIFYGDGSNDKMYLRKMEFREILQTIEDREFFYAVEDDE